MQIYSIYLICKFFFRKKFFFLRFSANIYVCLRKKNLGLSNNMNIQYADYQESKILIAWYRENKRNLPWRDINDPYRIWISEIMLQQTRVMQGIAYYLRFIERFPDVQSLAAAEQEEVLKYWQGLGYYSRARNLYEAAQYIQANHQGVFPHRYENVLALKGVGQYTAAAIVSFAWNQPYPAIDGNVYRVLGRLFAVSVPCDTGRGKKQYEELAALLMNPQQAGLHNQAIMEFGALQCVPHKPDCNQCPLQNRCLGYALGDPQQFPVKQHVIKVRDRYFNYFFVLHRGNTYLSRRTKKDIWKGLFEMPLIETAHPMDFEDIRQTDAFNELFQETGELVVSIDANEVRHVLSHQILHAKFHKIEIQKENSCLRTYIKVPLEKVDEYAVPRLIHRFFLNRLNT